MGELVRRGGYAPAGYGDHWPSRSEARAIREIEGRGAVERQADIEQGRRAANRIDVINAVGGHASERHADLIRYQREIAAGDAGIELELAPIRGAVLRKSVGMIERLYGPLG